MKKTIIAAAVAAVVAAPAAMAEVKISGQVGFETWDNDSATGQQSAAYNDFVVTASEDLGNGVKASAKYHVFNDMTADATNNAATANTTVALSGDFGTIMGGRFETQLNAYFEPFADVAGTHAHSIELGHGDNSREDGAGFQYTSPSFNGLTVVLAAQQADDDASGAASTTDNDITDMTVKYSNGPLTVAAGQYKYDDATNDMKVTHIAASYKMGDLTVKLLNNDTENDNGTTTDTESTVLGVAYAMGQNTIAASVKDSDGGEDGDSLLTLTHNFSKSTKAYISFYNDDDGNDSTLIGLNKKF